MNEGVGGAGMWWEGGVSVVGVGGRGAWAL